MAEKEGRGFTITDRRTIDREGGEPPASAPAEQPQESPKGQAGPPPLPEIDFGMFVMSLATSVLAELGELSPPGHAELQKNLPLAKQTIDILGMLEQKTRGNLTSDEAQLLQHLLYDLRLKYVDAKNKP